MIYFENLLFYILVRQLSKKINWYGTFNNVMMEIDRMMMKARMINLYFVFKIINVV